MTEVAADLEGASGELELVDQRPDGRVQLDHQVADDHVYRGPGCRGRGCRGRRVAATDVVGVVGHWHPKKKLDASPDCRSLDGLRRKTEPGGPSARG